MEPVLLFAILALILSIVIHEVAHGYAAEWLGDPTARLQGRLTLNPVSHVDPLGSIIIPGLLMITSAPFLFGWAKPVPYNPYNLRHGRWGEALVAGAGPGVNLLIALFFGLLIRFDAFALLGQPMMTTLAFHIVYINVLLALFNLIPFPPLDGSKILRALLSFRGALLMRRIEERLAMFGFAATFVFIAVFIMIAWPYFATLISLLVTIIVGENALSLL